MVRHPRRRALAASVATALTAAALAGGSSAFAANTAQAGIVTANPADFTPQVTNGSVNAIVQVGNRLIAAGTFTKVRQKNTSADVVRNKIFAFDATTGLIDPTFDPNLGGGDANSLATDGTNVYVGGTFSTVNGVKAARVVKLNPATGAIVTTLKSPNSAVNEVVVRGSRLYVGGAFTKVGTTARTALAAYDTTSGALLSQVNVPFTGLYNGGSTTIKRMDLSPDGIELVAVGNFTSVGGAAHSQVVMVDTPPTGTAAVAGWATNRYDASTNPYCASVFDSFVRDVDFAPDGSYFVVSATGAFGGGPGVGTLCDTTTRWETQPSNGSAQPTWADYTGGDTTYGVAITGTAVYVGGHMRWENNSFQGDQAGPGAVPREGIAALDPVNGLPLSWNPGRDRGVGAQALYTTDKGLWVGSDTKRIGGETHQRIAFFPLDGGSTPPVVTQAPLPGTLLQATRPPSSASGVLWRVDAAGPALQSSDSGPDWQAAGDLVSGGNVADWGATVPVDGTVPASTPPNLFQAERWGPQSWHLPVTAGKHVQVRLYFANQYSGTSQAGQRVFDIGIDGTTVKSGFDIVATTGDHRGTMQSFDVTSDGAVDITLSPQVENPLVNGIEVVDPSVPPSSTPGVLAARSVDGTGAPTSAATTANSSIDWSTVRGAFLVNGTLYAGQGDGRLVARTYSASTGAVGPARVVNLYDDPDDGTRIPFAIASSTGMFYDPQLHRLYYTLFGDSHLYYRYFTPESEVVGAQTFTADAGGVDFSTAAGLTLAGGKVLYGSSADGALRTVGFSGGAVTGAPTVVSNDGSWTGRALLATS